MYLTPGPWLAKGYPLVSGPSVQTITLSDAGFPRRLRAGHDAIGGLPSHLEVRGSLVEHRVAVAIVGARAALAEDLERAHQLAGEVVRRGGVVVSGGAIGVDSAAHRGALAAGGATVVVLGTGIDVLYPARNRALFIEIMRTGAVVSSLPADAPPFAGHFVRRNATIAALADVTVVVAARASSGSIHTAEAALRLGRQVAACPGTPGCERLLAGGAALIESTDDLARCLDGAPRHRVAERPAAGSEAHRVLDALSDREPRDVEDVAARAGVPLRAAQRALADLELRGLALLAPGQSYVRSLLAGNPA